MRKNAFSRQELQITDLVLDPTNPRIRLRSNATRRDCIEQMAEDGDHLVALSKDIATNGLGLDPIVVEPDGDTWLVRDGNRRISCLHMLHNPNLAPERIRGRIQRIAEGATPPEIVECHVSEDKDAIREHMHRKHSGEGQGEGLRAWKTVEQARWEIDNGYSSNDESAAYIVRYAEDRGLISIPPDLPITTLTRFLNNERIKEIGFDDLSTRPPTLNKNESIVSARVRKIIEDLDTKHINVSRDPKVGSLSMMEAEHQETYLREVLATGRPANDDQSGEAGESEGYPNSNGTDAHAGPEVSDGHSREGDQPISVKGRGGRPQQPSWKRLHVTSPVSANGVQRLPNDAKKAKAVHDELRGVNVSKHPNACAVLVRMFLELSVNAYIERKGLQCNSDELGKRVKKSVDNMVAEGAITDGREANGYKQHTSNEHISTQTLHGFVHQEFVAEQQIVNTFWDNILPFLRHCWHS